MILELSPEVAISLQRSALLAGPVLTSLLLVALLKPTSREAAAAMVGFLWQLPSLLLLNIAAAKLDWWAFNVSSDQLMGMPIDVWIGWAVWWGPVAVFLHRWIPLWALVALSVGIDLASMPMLHPLVVLGPFWIVGDGLAMALCLAPGVYAAKLTRDDFNPKRRAMFHVLGWGGYMCFVLPIATLSYELRPVTDLYHLPVGAPGYVLSLTAALLLFVGVVATAEFARAGDGTPIPYDPPKRVVTTGPYAFNANPMQIISAAVMALMAVYAQSLGLAYLALMFLVFDGVYAAHYNRVHIANAMPVSWARYRRSVIDWHVRWRPHVDGSAQIVISPDGPAHRIWMRCWPWLSSRLNGRFEVTSGDRTTFGRLIYRRPAAHIEDHGVQAAARILEHGPLPLAVVGWLIRFPYLGGGLQRLSALVIYAYRRSRKI